MKWIGKLGIGSKRNMTEEQLYEKVREQLYKKVNVIKGNHWCKICADKADFIIVSNTVYGIEKLPLCKKCAEMLKGKIDIGMKL